MADQLLFRGGNTVSIAGSTVSNREIVIDTQTNQIVLGSQKDRTVMQDGATEEVIIKGNVATLKLNSTQSTNPFQIYQDNLDGFIKNGTTAGNITLNTFGGGYLSFVSGSTERVRLDGNGNVLIGGTISSSPNTTLNQNGAATFSSFVTTSSYFRSQRTATNEFCFQATLNGAQTVVVKASGASTWQGDLVIGASPGSGANVGARLRSAGTVQSCVATSGTSVWAGFLQGNANATSQITAAGTAEFDGYVQSGENPGNGGGTGARINNNGSVTAGRTAGASNMVFSGFTVGTSDATSTISAAGAATFAAFVQSGGNPSNGTAVGTRLNQTGIVIAARSGAEERVWAGYQVGSSNTTSFITASGNATFDGDVAAANITAFKNQLATDAAAATTLADLKTAITDALALL